MPRVVGTRPTRLGSAMSCHQECLSGSSQPPPWRCTAGRVGGRVGGRAFVWPNIVCSELEGMAS
eukprot:7904652-Lingulodinium_polyedra.AAC.1